MVRSLQTRQLKFVTVNQKSKRMSLSRTSMNATYREPLLSVEELAHTLQVTTGTVYRLVREDGLPGVRVGGQWRFRRDEFERWLDSRHRDA
jgi:excisionase family DNA binding protein